MSKPSISTCISVHNDISIHFDADLNSSSIRLKFQAPTCEDKVDHTVFEDYSFAKVTLTYSDLLCLQDAIAVQIKMMEV